MCGVCVINVAVSGVCVCVQCVVCVVCDVFCVDIECVCV